MTDAMALSPVVDALQRDLRRERSKRRLSLARRLIEARREVAEETGYGSYEDQLLWAQRIVEGTGE